MVQSRSREVTPLPPTPTSTVAAIVVTNSVVTLAVTSSQPERCCVVCPYRPERVAWLMRMIEELAQSGYSPSEAMATVLAQDNLPGGAFGPTMRRGMDDVADIGRAIKAGKRNPVDVSNFLCPFSLESDTD